MRASSMLLQNKRIHDPYLKVVFAVTDGWRMPCADCTDTSMQNAHFEGFTQGVEDTNCSCGTSTVRLSMPVSIFLVAGTT